MHELFTKVSNVIENVVFVVFDVCSVQPALSGQPILSGYLAIPQG